LGPEVVDHVLQIAHAAITNVIRHAEASHVVIRLSREGDRVVLSIRDDGRGFDRDAAARRGGDGLPNMAGRASRMGGRLVVAVAESWGGPARPPARSTATPVSVDKSGRIVHSAPSISSTARRSSVGEKGLGRKRSAPATSRITVLGSESTELSRIMRIPARSG